MVGFLSKLRSFKNLRAPSPAPKQDDFNIEAEQKPKAITAPSPRTTGRQSISPKLRTFFELQTPKSPKSAKSAKSAKSTLPSPDSPESAYSGVALLGDVEIVRRLSKGKLKRIELSKIDTYKAVSQGTQTEDEGLVASTSIKDARKRHSGLAWEMLHSGDAGLLFVPKPEDGEGEVTAEQDDVAATMSLPLTGSLLRKLQAAIAADASLQACQKRTAREIAALAVHQEALRKRKEELKAQLEELKREGHDDADLDLDEEKRGVDRALVRVWEASIEAMDERLRSEERLEKKREEFERDVRGALAVLALALAERMLMDVVADDGEEGRSKGREVEFLEQRLRLDEAV